MARRAPLQQPGTSEQVVSTPPEFMAALAARGIVPDLDLAALPENSKAPRWYTPEDDGLVMPWDGQCMWLNPEYSDITRWVYRAACYVPFLGSARVHVLVPASVGANWFSEYVWGHCLIKFLNGRIKFIGHKHVYPKDLMLLEYGAKPGAEIWRWQS